MNRTVQKLDSAARQSRATEQDLTDRDGPSVPDHRLIRLIAAGAYGQVWLARNAVGTPRAVKLVRRDFHSSPESFQREFKGLQKFEPVSRSHEGLVDILTLGPLPEEAGFYYVMELADNIMGRTAPAGEAAAVPQGSAGESYQPRTLRADLKSRGALPAEAVIEIGIKLTAALTHLHGQGLVHRDVKPSNILFIGGEPKLADAGLVAPFDDAQSLVGTAGYIAPEGPGAPQADLYALGKVLYEAAFGKDRQEFPTLPADVASRPDHARLLELNEVIATACAYDPQKRYASADVMRAEIELLASGKSVKRHHQRRQVWSSLKRVVLGCILIAVGLKIAPSAKRGGANDYLLSAQPEVNKFVEQGYYAWREGTPPRMRYAEDCFQKALLVETNFVPALYGLAGVHLHERAKFREITEKLKRAAPDSAEACQCVAFDAWHQGQFQEALAAMKRATQKRALCKEGHVWAHGGYGYFLQNVGDAKGALEQYRIAEKIIDGVDPTILDHFGHAYYMRTNLEEALKYYQASIDFISTHLNGRFWKARTLEEMGRYEEAIKEDEDYDVLAEHDPNLTKRFYEELRGALRQRGPEGYWRKRLELASKESSPDLYYIATLYARLKDWPKAYDYLDKAFRVTPFAGELMVDLCWDRGDPRFQAFARKIGLMQ